MILIFGTLVWNDDISRCFFHFFEILIFQALRGVKGQKLAQNEKELLHLSCTISQEQYSIWSWFLVHMCKMMIYPGGVFSFLKLLFFGLLGGLKGQKNSSKWKVTITYVTHHTSGIEKHVIKIFGTLVLNDDIPRHFFHFFEIFIWVY